jgi:hypothetical protein
VTADASRARAQRAPPLELEGLLEGLGAPPRVPAHAHRFVELRASAFAAGGVPEGADLLVRFGAAATADGGPLPKRALWWAADALPLDLPLDTAMGRELAYGGYANMGVAARRRGALTVCLRTPRVYFGRRAPAGAAAADPRPRRWCRHLHFVPVHDGRVDPEATDVRTVAVVPGGDGTADAAYRCEPLLPYEAVPPHTPLFTDFDGLLRSRRRGAVGLSVLVAAGGASGDTAGGDGHDAANARIAADDLLVRVPPRFARTMDAAARAGVLRRALAGAATTTPLVVYGRHARCAAAASAVAPLAALGYSDVQLFEGGMEEASQRLHPLRAFASGPPVGAATAAYEKAEAAEDAKDDARRSGGDRDGDGGGDLLDRLNAGLDRVVRMVVE